MSDASNSNAGYVYILINAAFPEFIKIGLTTGDPKLRAKQLSSGTGIPAPYAVAWKIYVNDCNIVEQLAHSKLAAARVRNNREFFRLAVEEAIGVISELAVPFRMDPPNQNSLIQEQEVTENIQNELSSPHEPRPDKSDEATKTFLSVEAHSADQMAPKLKPAKIEVLAKLRELILKVAPDCLWMMRGDGKIIFTPLPHKDRSKFRNLMTVHLPENPVRYRIGKVLERFSDDQIPNIEVMLRALLIERN